VLERVLAFCGDEVEDEQALSVLGAVRTETLAGMVRGLAARDAAAMLRVLDALAGEGHDLLHFWGEMIAVLRDLILIRTLPDREDLLTRGNEEARALAEASEGLSREDLSRAFQILADLEPGLKGSSQPRFLFEAALVRLAGLGAVRPIEEILATLGPSGAGERKGAVSHPSTPREPHPPQKKKASDPSLSEVAGGAPPPAPREAAEPSPGAADDDVPLERFRERVWAAGGMLGASVAQAVSVTRDGGALRIEYTPALDAVRRVVEREANLATLRRCAFEALGERVEVRVEASVPGRSAPPAGAPPRDTASAVPAPRVTGASAALPAAEEDGGVSLLERARSEPGIRRLLSEFGAQVIEIRPLRAAPSPEPASADNDVPEDSR
jgi:DNA polymerase-3 subunit gamma/tau